MLALRSLLFNLLFFGWTALLCLLGLPLLLLPRGWLVRLGRLWTGGIFRFLAWTVGITHEIRGEAHRGAQAIYAFKHQSAWETVALPLLIRDPAIVLKRELLFVPVFGWYLMKTRQLAVDRRGGGRALKRLLRQARVAAESGRPLVIFPEGTRMAPGIHSEYQTGIAALYSRLELPVVPVALNSGLYWPRRSFFKHKGRIIVEFLPPIMPGLARHIFLAELEQQTEAACARLLVEATGGPR